MDHLEHEASTRIDGEYPTNRVIGVVEDAKAAEAVVSHMATISFDEDSVDVIGNDAAAEQIATYQEEHPWKAKFNQLMTFMSNESELIDQYNQRLNDGELIVSAEVEGEEQAHEVADVMRQHGGHYINYFGTQVITTLEP